MTTTNEINRLQCEKIVNESWSKARENYDELQEIINNEGPINEKEDIILMIAANAALQKMTLDNANDKKFIFPD